MLPYTADVHFNLVARYNADLGWMLALAVVLVLVTIGLGARGGAGHGRPGAALLALGWGWTGGVFFYQYFAPFNFAAPWYGAAFGVEALLLLVTGTVRGRLDIRLGRDPAGLLGWIGIALAVVAVPLGGWIEGFPVEGTRLPGVSPDATVLLTLALLAVVRPRIPVHLLILPVLWAFLSGWTNWVLGVQTGYLLPAFALAVIALAMRQRIFTGGTP